MKNSNPFIQNKVLKVSVLQPDKPLTIWHVCCFAFDEYDKQILIHQRSKKLPDLIAISLSKKRQIFWVFLNKIYLIQEKNSN